jgi:hypothetical protein
MSAKHVVDEVLRQMRNRAAEGQKKEVAVESGSWEE